MSTTYWNPAALSFYRRALRIRRLLVEPALRRRFVYNIREMISLFRVPSQVHAFKSHASTTNSKAFYEMRIAECIQNGHQDLNLIENILHSEPKLVQQLIHAFHMSSKEISFMQEESEDHATLTLVQEHAFKHSKNA